MEKLVAISELFDISLDELVLDKVVKKEESSEQVVKSEIYSDFKKNVLTEDNKQAT